MKMKKVAIIGLSVMLAAGLLVGCGNKDSNSAGKDSYEIGILQFANHGSLDNCREGLLQGLKEEGIEEGKNLKVTYKNSGSDTATDNQIASSFASKDLDMVCAIATPSAQSSYNAVKDKNIPVIYTAVTSPKLAGLVDENNKNIGQISGTSDLILADEQLKLIKDILPKAKKVGILYSTSEVNSQSGIEAYEKAAKKHGVEIITQGISSSADIPMATDSLIKKVDCITNLTDNTVVSNLPTILEKAKNAGIPVFGSEVEQVRNGCIGCVGIDYIKLGKQTGKMAAKVLKGEAEAKDMEFEIFKDGEVVLNSKVAEDLGIKLSKDLTEQASQTFDKIENTAAEK
ncbi:ABC transporter substrate-binding protein [Anaerofustis sp.]|uniref:ABC transporter substrate-binding protein n=1 Tax=Anaerofustis sp. TaxID=1872517 RepID=UPI0025C73BE7|nr:ABC transporter substrate-binding protein [Anaerofustis sp.]